MSRAPSRSTTRWVRRWKAPAARRPTPSSALRALARARPSSARSRTTSLAAPSRTTSVRRASPSTRRLRRTVLRPRAATCMVTPDGERTMNTYLGAAQDLHPADVDPDTDRGGRHHLSRGLSVGSAARQGSVPQGREDRARGRAQGGADAVGCVLRRPLSRRVPRPDQDRHGRPRVRQRERAEEPLRDRRFRHRGEGAARRCQARGGHPQREGLRRCEQGRR